MREISGEKNWQVDEKDTLEKNEKKDEMKEDVSDSDCSRIVVELERRGGGEHDMERERREMTGISLRPLFSSNRKTTEAERIESTDRVDE